jgi:hypothetical protein
MVGQSAPTGGIGGAVREAASRRGASREYVESL